MKNKHLVWAYLIILSIGTILSLYMPKNEAIAKEAIVIPQEAIRLRILANSDSGTDQALKRLIRDEVNANITNWVSELTSIDEARVLIQSKLPQIEKIAAEVARQQGSNQSVKVEFGKVKFPTKLYGQFLYPAGEYEAILITLGEGKGANWWCVLYPPLCFLDFANGVAVSDGFDEKKGEGSPKTKAVPQENSSAKGTMEEKNNGATKREMEAVETTEVVPSSGNQQANGESPGSNNKSSEPVFVENDEQPVEVKFFVKVLWEKLFE